GRSFSEAKSVAGTDFGGAFLGAGVSGAAARTTAGARRSSPAVGASWEHPARPRVSQASARLTLRKRGKRGKEGRRPQFMSVPPTGAVGGIGGLVSISSDVGGVNFGGGVAKVLIRRGMRKTLTAA